MSTTPPVIAIDGPSGAGKGTLCTVLAKKMNFQLLDSGAIYRVLALAAIRHQVDLDAEDALASLASDLNVSFSVGEDLVNVILDGVDVSRQLRLEQTGTVASKIAAFPKVRDALLRRQRAFATGNGLIADGRDMGTVVFPEAEVKIFLDASAEQRAKRRVLQLEAKGAAADYAQIFAEIADRDFRDRNRAVAPLKPANDALIIDSTKLTVDEVITIALQYINSKLN